MTLPSHRSLSSSLIITTYNWHEALELVLLSVLRQKQLPDEVLIADDGSSDTTALLIKDFKKKFPIPITHVWHSDKGNRKSKILNKTIVKAQGDYIIQVDGDIILHSSFVKDHLQLAQKGCFLYGSRANIKESFLPTLFQTKQCNFHFFSKGITKRSRLFRLVMPGFFYKKEAYRSSKFRGCNVSYWKQDCIEVNGYNEAFTGWGMEDSEFIQRMLHKGVMGKRLKNRALSYHIYHKVQSKHNVSKNNNLQNQTIANKTIRAQKGIDAYLNSLKDELL